MEEGPTGPRTYYGGTVEAELPEITSLSNLSDPRIVVAVNKAFDEAMAKAEQAPLHIKGAKPDPDGELHLVETIDAETGNLIITWRLPFIEAEAADGESVH
jgi:hypothetical protein